MQMHNCARLRALRVDGEVKNRLLRGRIARNETAVPVEFGEPHGIQAPEARIGRRYEIAVGHARADIAATAGAEPTVEERAPEGADFVAQSSLGRNPRRGFVHVSVPHALRKKSGAPKLPDLSAKA